jgi:hypothetical protein
VLCIRGTSSSAPIPAGGSQHSNSGKGIDAEVIGQVTTILRHLL